MRYGSRYSCAFGSNSDLWRSVTIKSSGGSLVVTVVPYPGYGNRYASIYINGLKEKTAYISEGTNIISVPNRNTTASRIVCQVEDCGAYPSLDFNPYFNSADYESLMSNKLKIYWEPGSPLLEVRNDISSQISNVYLSGLDRSKNMTVPSDEPQQGMVDLSITTTASNTFNSYSYLNKPLTSVCTSPNGDVYVCEWPGDIYQQVGGTGSFVALGQTSRNWAGIESDSAGNIYALEYGGDVYVRYLGVGDFLPLGQTSRNWSELCVNPSGEIYATVWGGDIYKRAASGGNFEPLGQTSRQWWGIRSDSSGNIYAVEYGGYIYKQTLGSGNFEVFYEVVKNWSGICNTSNGDIYASVSDPGDVYVLRSGGSTFTPLSIGAKTWENIKTSNNNGVFVVSNDGYIYKKAPDSYTIDLYCNNLLIASGSCTGTPSTVNLYSRGSSSINGSLILTFSKDLLPGQLSIVAHWPKYYNVHYSACPLAYPRRPEAIVNDTGDPSYVYLSETLPSGTYAVKVFAVSEANVEDEVSIPEATVTLKSAPNPPTSLYYISGDYSNLRVGWTASTTSGVSYNVYVENGSSIFDFDNPTASTSSTDVTLPAVSIFPGEVRVIVRATKDGVEEVNTDTLTIELDANGQYVYPRPESTIKVRSVGVSGLYLGVSAEYYSNQSSAYAAAACVLMFMWKPLQSTPDLDVDAPSASACWIPFGSTHKRGTVYKTVSEDGEYYFVLRSTNAYGDRSFETDIHHIYLSSAVPRDVESLEASPSGG